MNRNNLKLAALLPLLLILALGCCLPAFAEALSAQNPKETMPSVRSQQPGAIRMQKGSMANGSGPWLTM